MFMSLWRTETEISLFIYLLVSYKDFDFISIFFLVFHEFYFVEAYRKSPPHAASVITTHLLICEFLYKWVHVQYCIRITKPIKTLKGLILFVIISQSDRLILRVSCLSRWRRWRSDGFILWHVHILQTLIWVSISFIRF